MKQDLKDKIISPVVGAAIVILLGGGGILLAACGSGDAAATEPVSQDAKLYKNVEVVVPSGVKVFNLDTKPNEIDGDWPKVATWCDGTTRYTVTVEMNGGSGAVTGGDVNVTPRGCEEDES